jgi:hypothetical protein
MKAELKLTVEYQNNQLTYEADFKNLENPGDPVDYKLFAMVFQNLDRTMLTRGAAPAEGAVPPAPTSTTTERGSTSPKAPPPLPKEM